MTFAIGYVLSLLVVALILFALDRFPLDVVAVVLLVLLILPPDILTVDQAFAGFGSETTVVLVSLFILTSGVTRTGVVDRIGMRMASFAGAHPKLLVRLLLLTVTVFSGFISNTVTTALFLPLTIGAAKRAKIAVGKVLMPLAFASVLAGGVSLIATSTNLVISGELPKHGLEPIGFFEMAPAGIVIAIVGLLYLWFVAPHLVPDRGDPDVIERYNLRRFVSEVVLTKGSRLEGKSVADLRLEESMDLTVLGVRRHRTRILAPTPSVVLVEGDVLLVEGLAEDILSVKDASGLEIEPDFKLSGQDLESEHVRMVEAMVSPRSNLVGSTLRESLFRERTRLTVLGIHRPGEHGPRAKLSRRRIAAGDVMLLQGELTDIQRLDNGEVVLLDDKSAHHPRTIKSGIAIAVFIGSIVLAAMGLVPTSVAFLVGVPILILTRCLEPKEVYDSVDWRLIVMIGAMMAFGAAMTATGTAEYLAKLIVTLVSGFGPMAILAAFFVLTAFLTQPMSNQAAALVVLPVAISVARQMNIEPRALVMSVTFAASCSFLTPLEPSCVLVYGPGRYRFFDFVRVGGILTVIVFVVAMWLIPVLWPLKAVAGS